MTRIVRLGRSVSPKDEPVAPPSYVWPGIIAGIRFGKRAGRRRAGNGRRARWVLAAAIAGMFAGAGAVLGWQAATTAPSDVVARTGLESLPDRTSAGTAQLVEARSQRWLVVDLEIPDDVDGYLEAWLLTQDATGLVSLGVVHSEVTEVPIPAGLELSEYPILDVSVEPLDGNPAHSGASLVRGQWQGY